MKTVIVSGGELGEWALEHIKGADFLIGVDRGAYFLAQRNIKMNLAIGDFDSVNEAELLCVTQFAQQSIRYKPEKDETDTELALKAAIKISEKITIVGGLGGRHDHTLANLHLLYKSKENGCFCELYDEKHHIILVHDVYYLKKDKYKLISLIPFTTEVSGISVMGCRYPLNNATFKIGVTRGISNYLVENEGVIRVKEGALIVVRAFED
jgi:thiamine pyrophosphokinase